MKHYNYKPITIGQLLGLFAALLLFACTSCEAENDTECDRLTQQYMQSMQNTHDPAAQAELRRQYLERVGNLGC